MNKAEAQHYIENNIPITKIMGMTITDLSRKSVRIAMPHAPNVNHQGSAFGGSIDSLFFVTCWAYVQLLIEDFDPHPRIVGRRGKSTFSKPIKSDFEAKVLIPEDETVNQFLADLSEKGKGRLTAKAVVEYEGEIAAEFEGDFVVLKG
ncbi:MAG: YiiD C-terminal domain-containing protein [Balneolaceae bacterium]|nr:YiiD C-terminal domain-containing protein [Balneolaceae bacterium]